MTKAKKKKRTLEEEWQRQGIVKYDDSYSDETEEDNFLTMDWELDCKKSWKTYSTRR